MASGSPSGLNCRAGGGTLQQKSSLCQRDSTAYWCTPRRRVRTWHKLERALLLQFRDLFGRVPICNTHGQQMVETDEFYYFARARVTDVIEDLS